MKKILLTSALAAILNINTSVAVVTEYKTINNIHDIVLCVQKNIPLDENNQVMEETVAVFDWDRVIIKDRPLKADAQEIDKLMEVGEFGTLETILKLHGMGVKTCVLTSRGNGVGLNGGRSAQFTTYDAAEADALFRGQVDGMMNVFNIKENFLTSWFANGALKYGKDELTDEALLEYDQGDEYDSGLETPPSNFVMKDQITFGGVNSFDSGNSVKGRVLEQLIEKRHFKKQSINVLFADDQYKYISEVKNIFSKPKRQDVNTYIFQYVGQNTSW